MQNKVRESISNYEKSEESNAKNTQSIDEALSQAKKNQSEIGQKLERIK